VQLPQGDAVYRVEPGQTPDYATQNPLERLLAVVESTRLAADRENYAPESVQYLLPHSWLALYGPRNPNTDVLDPTQQDFKTDFQKQNVADFRLGDLRLVRGVAYAFDWTGPFLHMSYRAGPDSALSQAAAHQLGDRLILELSIQGGGDAELTAPYDPGSGRYVAELWGFSGNNLADRLGPRGKESLERGVLQARPDLARGAAAAFAYESVEDRDLRNVATDHVLHPVLPLRLRIRWRTADGRAADPAEGQEPFRLAYEMVVRGWDYFLKVGPSLNPHGGVNGLEYRTLLSNYFEFDGSGELGRRLEGWNLDASGAKAAPGEVENFLAVDYMDLHLMESGCGIGLHRHRDNSEAFLMLDGEGWMVIGDWAENGRRTRCFEVRLLRSGHLALLKGGNLHGLFNPGAGRAALFMLGGYD
jgi:mannose-6-phosphate isomerase-like protein (cupin superfamily)